MTLRQREFLRMCGYEGPWLDAYPPDDVERLLRMELYYEITPKDHEPVGPVEVEAPWEWRIVAAVRVRGTPPRATVVLVNHLYRQPRNLDGGWITYGRIVDITP